MSCLKFFHPSISPLDVLNRFSTLLKMSFAFANTVSTFFATLPKSFSSVVKFFLMFDGENAEAIELKKATAQLDHVVSYLAQLGTQ